jgi:circadian clock protein KaiC
MQTAAVEELRRFLSRTAPFYGEREGKKSGLDTLDQLLGGGLPKGAITILTGDRGAGRLTLAARIAAEETERAARSHGSTPKARSILRRSRRQASSCRVC